MIETNNKNDPLIPSIVDHKLRRLASLHLFHPKPTTMNFMPNFHFSLQLATTNQMQPRALAPTLLY